MVNTGNTYDTKDGGNTWLDTLYEKTFNEEYEGLRRRFAAEKTSAKDFTVSIEALLKTLYDMDGADWLGRGEVQSTNMSATIAAYESFIADFKAKKIKNPCP